MRYVFLLVLVAGCDLDTAGLEATQAPAVQVPPVVQSQSVDARGEAAAEVAASPAGVPACGDIPGGLAGAKERCATGMNWMCETGCISAHGDLLRDLGMTSCQTRQDGVETICVLDCSQCPPTEP